MIYEKVIVVFSGGLDSTTLLYRVYQNTHEITAVLFDYGQRHKKELIFALEHIRLLNIEYVKLPLKLNFISSALTSRKMEIPKGEYNKENQKQTVVPNRNMIMLSTAAGIAEDRNISKVYYAAHKNDSALYPDCRPEFVEAVSKATQLGTYNKVEIIAPFLDYYKYQIVKVGLEIGVNYHKTWSCYEGKEHHCLKCGTCLERIEAFEKNGLKPIMP